MNPLWSTFDATIRDTLTSSKYRDPERTFNDVAEVLVQYQGLQPVAENYVFNDGTDQILLKLAGTLPIVYKGSVYNIPLDIWVLNTYPYNAPMVRLCPTPEMRVKVSANVLSDGRVKLPYLQEWKHNSPDNELLLLIQVLIITFQDEPPVYSVFSSPQSLSPPFNGYVGIPPLPHRSPQVCGLSPQRLELLQSATERLLRRLHSIYISVYHEQKNSEKLRDGGERLALLVDRLESEKLNLEEQIKKHESDVADLSAQLVSFEADVEEREENIEDSIFTPRPLYRQIVETATEDAAVQDAIYYVCEGFRKEGERKMDLEQFEKTIRKLARKQFMLRVLLRQGRDKAGLH